MNRMVTLLVINKMFYRPVLFICLASLINGFKIPFSPLTTDIIPLCANCQEAIMTEQSVLCKLFGSMDPIWGDISYKSSIVCRQNNTLCGPSGRYYHYYSVFDDTL